MRNDNKSQKENREAGKKDHQSDCDCCSRRGGCGIDNISGAAFFQFCCFSSAASGHQYLFLLRAQQQTAILLSGDRKNGKNIRVEADEVFEITYRDEFVIKSVGSDDIGGKYTKALMEGTGNEGNQIGMMFRGIDFVNHIMQSDVMAKGAQSVSIYKIAVFYKNEKIGVVPVRVVITAQDWLRFAKDSANANVQIEYLKKAIAQNSSDAGVRKILAGIYLKQNKIEEAAKLYEEILRLKPEDTATMKELARCYLKTNQILRAMELLSGFLRLQPQDVEALSMLGLAYGNKNMWDKAVELYRQAVKLEPENSEIRFMLAEALEKTGKTNAALEQYQYVAAHAQDATPALRVLGEAHLRKKNYDQAVKSYLQIVKINPKDAAAYANLATAYAGQGKAKEEMACLKKAVELMPGEPTIRFNLAAAYEKEKKRTMPSGNISMF